MVVVPDVTPVTKPVDPTVALADEDDHVPPVVASVRVVVADTHTDDKPDMVPAVGSALTVTAFVALQPVGKV